MWKVLGYVILKTGFRKQTFKVYVCERLLGLMMEDFFINNTWLLFVVNVKYVHINHLLYSYTDNHNGPTVHSIQEDKLNTGTKSTRVSFLFTKLTFGKLTG